MIRLTKLIKSYEYFSKNKGLRERTANLENYKENAVGLK